MNLSLRKAAFYPLAYQNPNGMAPKPGRREGADGCTDWYWVTISYWSDGSTTVTSTYMYTECVPDGDCWQPRIINGLNLKTSCSGGNVGIEFESVATVQWQPYLSPDGHNEIVSIESLHGKRAINNGSTFTKFGHASDRVFNNVPEGNQKFATGTKTNGYTLTPDKKDGTAFLSGMLSYPGGTSVNFSNKQASWNAHATLP